MEGARGRLECQQSSLLGGCPGMCRMCREAEVGQWLEPQGRAQGGIVPGGSLSAGNQGHPGPGLVHQVTGEFSRACSLLQCGGSPLWDVQVPSFQNKWSNSDSALGKVAGH